MIQLWPTMTALKWKQEARLYQVKYSYIYTVSFFIFYNSRGCFEFPKRKRLIYNLPIGGLKLLLLFDLTKSFFFSHFYEWFESLRV